MNVRDEERRNNREARISGDWVLPSAASHLSFSGMRLFCAALREIFDESAYARFLARNGLCSSGAAYAAFLQEKSGTRPRPRCC